MKEGQVESVTSRRLPPAALVLAALASGCGGQPQPSGEAVAAKREWQRLAVVVDGQPRASAWAVDVPVAAGWKATTVKDFPGMATITRPFAKGCELFLQVTVVGSSDGVPDVGRPKRRRGIERGERSAVVATPSGERHFDVTTRVAKTGSLVFGGGATGPGGFALVDFAPRAQSRDVPAIAVLAQGGTDGSGCFSVSLQSAPGLALRALEPIARMTRLASDG
jgi:hypothetical protein